MKEVEEVGYYEFDLEVVVFWKGTIHTKFKRKVLPYQFNEVERYSIIARSEKEAQEIVTEKVNLWIKDYQRQIIENTQRQKRERGLNLAGTNAETDNFQWSKLFRTLDSTIQFEIKKIRKTIDYSKETYKKCQADLTVAQFKEMFGEI